MFLLVDSKNIAAQKLYQKLGYKKMFEDNQATCVTSSPTGLRTSPCVNYCFKKDLSLSPSKQENGILNWLGGIFGSKK